MSFKIKTPSLITIYISNINTLHQISYKKRKMMSPIKILIFQGHKNYKFIKSTYNFVFWCNKKNLPTT